MGSRECHVWVDGRLCHRDSPNSPAQLPVITCVPTTGELQLPPSQELFRQISKTKDTRKNKTCVQAYEWV